MKDEEYQCDRNPNPCEKNRLFIEKYFLIGFLYLNDRGTVACCTDNTYYYYCEYIKILKVFLIGFFVFK